MKRKRKACCGGLPLIPQTATEVSASVARSRGFGTFEINPIYDANADKESCSLLRALAALFSIFLRASQSMHTTTDERMRHHH